ncbi:hypothetical protein QYF36_017371 [Acer negundo]|nr:hypothetical protein QYF36_017371 [Acer negundo]
MGELLAVREGLLLAKLLKLPIHWVEVDASNVVSAVNTPAMVLLVVCSSSSSTNSFCGCCLSSMAAAMELLYFSYSLA